MYTYMCVSYVFINLYMYIFAQLQHENCLVGGILEKRISWRSTSIIIYPHKWDNPLLLTVPTGDFPNFQRPARPRDL